MLRLRLFSKNTEIKKIEADTFKEYGTINNMEFNVTKNKKEGKKAFLNLETIGSVQIPDRNSDSNISLSITKKLIIEDNNIKILIEGEFFDDLDLSNLEKILSNLSLGIDIPFFFNGDPNHFKWTSNTSKIREENNEFLDSYKYLGKDFEAYDQTYDLKYKLNIDTSRPTTIIKFPIIAHVYTENGYKRMFQGMNILPIFDLDKSFQIEINLKIQ
jgi:hypothetical protein